MNPFFSIPKGGGGRGVKILHEVFNEKIFERNCNSSLIICLLLNQWHQSLKRKQFHFV